MPSDSARLGGIRSLLAARSRPAPAFETHVTTLGHVQRGRCTNRTPTACSTTRFGLKAAGMVFAGELADGEVGRAATPS